MADFWHNLQKPFLYQLQPLKNKKDVDKDFWQLRQKCLMSECPDSFDFRSLYWADWGDW